MSLPSPTSPFTSARAVRAWVDYPFADDGDTTSKVYVMECVVEKGSYTAPAFSDTMDSALVAKLVELPFAADTNAYFVGDDGFFPYDGGNVIFTRRFMPVPATRTRGIGSYSHTWPAFRDWSGAQDALSNVQVFDADPPELPPVNVVRNEVTTESPASITYTYSYATSIGSVATDQLWLPRWQDSALVYDFRDVPTDNFLVNNGVGGQPYGTSVTVTDYENNYINDQYLIVSSRIKSYMGNIYVRETIKALAQ